MYHPTIEKTDVARCLLCHDAPCRKECPHLDPARILRSLRFQNEAGAALLLPEEDVCVGCASPCRQACPAEVPIPGILACLREDREHIEPAPGAEMVDLSCDLCGVPLENPFLLSSSVVASGYEMCARAFEMGWAGISYKTMCTMEIHETSPRFSALKDGSGAFYGFKNIEQLSPHSMQEDLEILSRLKQNYPTKVIVASIMGQNEEEWTQLAKAVTHAGADVLELNFSCPNMEEKGVGVDIGQDPDAVRRFTAAARRGTEKPILAKMTPNLADMCPAARAAMEGGANGIAAINTVKSITNVNLDTYATAPAVKGRSAVGGYSGAAVKPIALRFLADLGGDAALEGAHLSGMGGIETWRDALEFLVLGAGSLQITTAVMQYGYRIIDDLLQGLRIYMAQRGYQRVSELIGLGVDNVVDAAELERDSIVYPKFHRNRCVGCGRCFLSCRDGGHQAIRFNGESRKPILIPDHCVGCHLCVMVCPREAISAGRKRMPADGRKDKKTGDRDAAAAEQQKGRG